MSLATLVSGLADRVQKQLADERAAHRSEVAGLRTELLELREALKAHPAPEKGEAGPIGPIGPQGEQGPPGISIVGERGEKGLDGRDGRDGKDGIASLDDLRAEVNKAVEVAVSFAVEKAVAEAFSLLPTLQYKGVFQDGTEYRAGDCVTFGGSLFHCNESTGAKPEDGKSWTLAVKRGRDGKDAR